MNNVERRTEKGFKLREYRDALKEARSLTDVKWIEIQSQYAVDQRYIDKVSFVEYLQYCHDIEEDEYLKQE